MRAVRLRDLLLSSVLFLSLWQVVIMSLWFFACSKWCIDAHFKPFEETPWPSSKVWILWMCLFNLLRFSSVKDDFWFFLVLSDGCWLVKVCYLFLNNVFFSCVEKSLVKCCPLLIGKPLFSWGCLRFLKVFCWLTSKFQSCWENDRQETPL